MLADARVATAFAAVLQAGNVLAQLIEHRQMAGQRGEAGIGWRRDPVGGGRAGRDQGGVKAVVLGPPQHEAGIGAHLGRLEEDHDKPVAAQLRHHRPLVAAARLDANPLDPMPAQPPR